VKPLWEFIGSASADAKAIEPEKLKALKHWNKLIRQLKDFSSETILASEFGATYPLEGLLPGKRWRHHCGAFGNKLSAFGSRDDALQALPHYADVNNNGAIPNWIRKSILYSRALYESNPQFFDEWKQEIRSFHNSWQKLEWRGDRRFKSIWKQTLQFRASGIRVMKPEMAPSLVAMTTTQTPIIGAIKRHLGIREAASLQALEGLAEFPASQGAAFGALGNAVNAHIVNKIVTALL
jgi:DNA (cytosine-5)-methyltransferase 1